MQAIAAIVLENTLLTIRDVQRRGGVCAVIDLLGAFDTAQATSLELDLESLLVSQPDTGAQATEIVDTLARTGAIDLIVVLAHHVRFALPEIHTQTDTPIVVVA